MFIAVNEIFEQMTNLRADKNLQENADSQAYVTKIIGECRQM